MWLMAKAFGSRTALERAHSGEAQQGRQAAATRRQTTRNARHETRHETRLDRRQCDVMRHNLKKLSQSLQDNARKSVQPSRTLARLFRISIPHIYKVISACYFLRA